MVMYIIFQNIGILNGVGVDCGKGLGRCEVAKEGWYGGNMYEGFFVGRLYWWEAELVGNFIIAAGLSGFWELGGTVSSSHTNV